MAKGFLSPLTRLAQVLLHHITTMYPDTLTDAAMTLIETEAAFMFPEDEFVIVTAEEVNGDSDFFYILVKQGDGFVLHRVDELSSYLFTAYVWRFEEDSTAVDQESVAELFNDLFDKDRLAQLRSVLNDTPAFVNFVIDTFSYAWRG